MGRTSWGAPALNDATEYFNRQAADYGAASNRFPWSWLRAWERRSVLGLMGPLHRAEVLELGCGAGYYTRVLLQEGAARVWAVDRAQEMLRQLPPDPRITTVQGDAASVRLERTFPAIAALGVFEFVEASDVLRNAALHADPRAWLVVLFSLQSVPGMLIRGFHASHGVDARLYSLRHFEHAARSTGWQLEANRKAGLFGMAARFRRTIA